MEKQENKTIKMDVTKGNKNVENPKKYSYEQLDHICGQLVQENNKLRERLQQIEMAVTFKRIDFLLKIIELSDQIKDAEFVASCIEELKLAMSAEEPQEEEK